MKPESFVYLSSTPSKSSAEMLCAWIEDLGIPVLMAHEGDLSNARFSIYVPESSLETITKRREMEPGKRGGARFSQAFAL